MSRIYVASSWRNNHQGDVVALLRAHGHLVYDFKNPPHVPGFKWLEIDREWATWTAEQYRQVLVSNPIAAHGYLQDFRGMEWADTCVLVLPCGRSAHLEAGWFAGRGKRLVIYTRDGEEPELMALMANEIVVSDAELLAALAVPRGTTQAEVPR